MIPYNSLEIITAFSTKTTFIYFALKALVIRAYRADSIQNLVLFLKMNMHVFKETEIKFHFSLVFPVVQNYTVQLY